jgi:hypothetical protein
MKPDLHELHVNELLQMLQLAIHSLQYLTPVFVIVNNVPAAHVQFPLLFGVD